MVEFCKGIKESMSVLEEELLKLQDFPIFTNDGKKKYHLLAELLGLTTQDAINRSRYQSVELMDAPSNIFFFFLI